MKVAITGATGGLGRSLCEFLFSRQIQVVALGRNKMAGEDLKKKGAIFLQGEITDQSYLNAAFQGCDAVIHSAGLASPWGAWEKFQEANVTGTECVLKSIRQHSIKKLIHLSTPSIYFAGRDRKMIREDEPVPAPLTNYAKSKIMADEMIARECAETNLSAVLLRPRAIFGKYDQAIVPRIVRMMETGKFPLPAGGNAFVDVTAVENVIEAIRLFLWSDKMYKAEAFNITNDEPMQVKELTRLIAETLKLKVTYIPVPLALLTGVAKVAETYANLITHREPKITTYSIQSLGVTQTLCIDKLKKETGFKPVITIREALKQLERAP